ncbi:molybdenum cofactor guanylyltransferase [Paenibacillus marchantiophytorum]|nr:molybdenum cofactor guanylyltransferase [Paenibacillus marchantiophytorum]
MGMLSGVILAGGANHTMNGELTALLPFDGKALIVRQIDRMREICDEIIIVTNDPKPYLNKVDRSVRIITDFFAGQGPLGGMHAALSLAKYASVWIVGCDMPLISNKAAQLLMAKKQDGFEAVIPIVAGEPYPLHGIYDRACAARIAPLFNQGKIRVSAMLNHVIWSELGERYLLDNGIDLNFVANIKTIADYEAIQHLDK